MKTTNSKEEKIKMSKECPNCGYKMSMKDKTCKYCGSKNENYSRLMEFVEEVDEKHDTEVENPASLQITKSSLAILGVVFLFVFFPVGIILLLLAARVDKNN